jgi:hypothetical protein
MKIVPEPDGLDGRVPLGILAVAVVMLSLSGILAVAVRASVPVAQVASAPLPRASATMPEPALQTAQARPLRAPEPHVAYATDLFERHAPPVATRQLPERLNSYGWVDRERRIVHIPIERAKQLYLSRQHAGRGRETLPVSQRQGHER